MNFHLKESGNEKRVNNLGKDLSDSEALIIVLNRLGGAKCPLDALNESDLNKRAQHMINNACALGVPEILGPNEITSGNTKVNTLFVAQIFNTCHGLV